jgi:hypothetical protein
VKLITLVAALALMPAAAAAWTCPGGGDPSSFISPDGKSAVELLPSYEEVVFSTPAGSRLLKVFWGGPGWGYAAPVEHGQPSWTIDKTPDGILWDSVSYRIADCR